MNIRNPSMTIPQQTHQSNKAVFIIAAITALGGLLFGYNVGIIGIALLGLAKQFVLTVTLQQIITSATILGALGGCMLSQPISDRLGYRPTLLILGVWFCVASLACALSPSINGLIVSRFLLGLPIGGATQIIPVYIAELAPARHRGKMVVFFQLMVITGITLAYFGGLELGDHWRWMFGLGILPAIALLLGMSILPESPRWLVMKKRPQDAYLILKRIRGNEQLAQQEIEAIEKVSHQPKGSWKEVMQPWVRPAIVVGASLAMFCQITGNNALIYYAPIIFTKAGFSHTIAIIGSGISIFIIAIMTIIGGILVDKIGRRRYLLWTVPGSIIALIAMGYLFLGNGPQTEVSKFLVIACLAVYMLFNGGSFGVCIWLINSEIYPLFIRGKGASIGAFSNWFFTLIVSLTTLSLVKTLGATYTFWLYALISTLALIFIYALVPETKGKSLEEIELELKNHRFYAFQQKKS